MKYGSYAFDTIVVCKKFYMVKYLAIGSSKPG
jgi:hypothetical protein